MIKHLIANGHTVRGTVRDAAKDGEHLKTLGAEVVEVKDLKDVEALAKAFAGVDGVFHMAAVHPEYGFADTPEGSMVGARTAAAGGSTGGREGGPGCCCCCCCIIGCVGGAVEELGEIHR